MAGRAALSTARVTGVGVKTDDADIENLTQVLLLAAEAADRGDTDRAEALYATAVLAAPQFAIARFQLGLLQMTAGRTAVALLTWQPLDALPAEDPLRLFKQAFERLSADDLGGADALLERGIAANTTNVPLNDDMARLRQRIADAQSAAGDSHVLLAGYGRLN